MLLAQIWIKQGFVHSASVENRALEMDDPFPSLDIDILRKQLSPSEVAAVIHLPLRALISPTRIRNSLFRRQEPYWVVDVTDIVQPTIRSSIRAETATTRAAEEIKDELGDKRIEVWGLTGWYLSLLLKILQVYR